MKHVTRGTRVRGLLLALSALASGWTAPSAAQELWEGRVQLHRAANRGVPYLPLARQGENAGASALAMQAVKTIELDGNALQNVYAGLRPIDVDGDGTYEFLHYNGFRFLQVWDATGRKLWRVADPAGRLHGFEEATHRDTLAVLDLDGDGKQDVAHCWGAGGRRTLVYRRGLDGKVIRSIPLEGSTTQVCQMAAFRMAATQKPQILVAHAITSSAKSSCRHNWVDYWARVVAFDTQQRKLWERDTCDAGHYAYPLDTNFDGKAEGVFVGKYLLRADGSLQCTLSGWPKTDHVDGLVAADIDRSRPGIEAVAIGRTGTALFEAATCREIWRIPATVVRDPQHVGIARLDPTSLEPTIIVDERGSLARNRLMLINSRGRIVGNLPPVMMPMQNANLDGALGVDEAVGSFGTVIDRAGNLRLTRWWYWDLKGTKVAETKSGLYPWSYDRWQAFPLVFDYDGDGKDELVQWGQSLIVIGKVR